MLECLCDDIRRKRFADALQKMRYWGFSKRDLAGLDLVHHPMIEALQDDDGARAMWVSSHFDMRHEDISDLARRFLDGLPSASRSCEKWIFTVLGPPECW